MQANAFLGLVFAYGTAFGQQVLTAPAAFDANDAPSKLWVAGFTTDLHQQVIIDARHLQPMAGHTITAMLWRRDASAETFVGGSASLTVQLAETSRDSLSASPSFAANLGGSPSCMFAGTVAIPTAAGIASTGLTWDAGITVRIAFQSGFAYSGGNLVVDLVGTTVAPSVAWWPADAVWDPAMGSVQSIGQSCSRFANATGESAGATARSLVPGATAMFWARGTENGLALLFLGTAPPSLPGIALGNLLPGSAPACMVYLPMPAELMIAAFSQVLFPGEGGRASYELPIPNAPWVLAATLGAQWMDLAQQFATSNALRCTVAAAAPSLGMCTVRGAIGQPLGSVFTHVAHVLRFEYQ